MDTRGLLGESKKDKTLCSFGWCEYRILWMEPGDGTPSFESIGCATLQMPVAGC